MASRMIFRKRDFDGDLQEFSYPANVTIETDWAEANTEINKWCAGAEGGGGIYEEKLVDSETNASSPQAQKKLQSIVEVTDLTNNKTYRYRMPMPNLAKADDGQVPPEPAYIRQGGLTVFNPDHTDYGTLILELEDHMLSPVGNTVNIERIYIEE